MNRSGWWVALLLGGMGGGLGLTACPPAYRDRCEGNVCEPVATVDGGDTGASDANVPTDECLTKPDAPECLSEEKAFFVSTSGSDSGGDGTKAKPFKTLSKTLGKISAEKKRIYICEGDYPEDVVLDAKHSGVSLFGGFACDWRASQAKPKFGDSALALKITGATGIAIASLAFEARDATAGGGSSVAAFVSNAEATFKTVSLTAGKGMAGDNGKLETFTFPAADELHGKNGDAWDGGATAVTCPGDTMTSTMGGAGGDNGLPGQPGTPGSPNGGSNSNCGSGGTGGDGAPVAPANPAPSGTSLGELVVDGWKPRAGDNGTKGAPGQGGGGGYGSGGAGSHGGGGGAGGCGGAGGGGGQGGGASIALAVHQSTVRIETSSVVANDAGKGGNGMDGQAGQTPGGVRGVATSVGTSCNGGNGSPGAKGGEGAGGAGGVSIGVLYKGKEPEIDGDKTKIVVQSPGAGGTGGKPGATAPANDGPVGVAAKIQDATQL